jgi:hypothetical protein
MRVSNSQVPPDKSKKELNKIYVEGKSSDFVSSKLGIQWPNNMFCCKMQVSCLWSGSWKSRQHIPNRLPMIGPQHPLLGDYCVQLMEYGELDWRGLTRQTGTLIFSFFFLLCLVALLPLCTVPRSIVPFHAAGLRTYKKLHVWGKWVYVDCVI